MEGGAAYTYIYGAFPITVGAGGGGCKPACLHQISRTPNGGFDHGNGLRRRWKGKVGKLESHMGAGRRTNKTDFANGFERISQEGMGKEDIMPLAHPGGQASTKRSLLVTFT